MGELIDNIGIGKNFFLIAGNCVVEDEFITLETAGFLKKLCKKFDVPLIYKSSYRKANRTSGNSFTSIGDGEALDILSKVKKDLKLPLLTDIHETTEIDTVKDIDVLQIPAFLCRQTNLIRKAAETGKWVNIKKGQFMSPDNMKEAAEKGSTVNGSRIMLTERGTTFGYNNLVVDFRGLSIMKKFGHPIIFDATHSVQRPGGLGSSSGGDREFIVSLARAAAAVGIDGLFVETHPEPKIAKSDAATQIPLLDMPHLIEQILKILKA
ncbi:MAG: 3-deoxy-8-phosphooctulonate synthase [candidate division Zixibacteria bacterium]|nr:3-deoxy-8-phosphooctulonate synthase [candidate division Zixibacteria bacterium]